MFRILNVILACSSMTWARELGKPFKPLPAISNSLVNLGKMDFAFYFNTKLPDLRSSESDHLHPTSFYLSKPDPVIEPCPCTAFNNMKSPFPPSFLINKITDLIGKDGLSSPQCCESHEHVQEETVFFEIGPKNQANQSPAPETLTNVPPFFPFNIDSIIPNKGPIQPNSMKPKAIEIFFFPKKKELNPFGNNPNLVKRKEFKKDGIQVVGDKEMRSDLKSFKFRPSYPLIVKKETDQAKEVPTPTEQTDTTTTVDQTETTIVTDPETEVTSKPGNEI